MDFAHDLLVAARVAEELTVENIAAGKNFDAFDSRLYRRYRKSGQDRHEKKSALSHRATLQPLLRRAFSRQWRRTRCRGSAVACSLSVSISWRRRKSCRAICTALLERPVASARSRKLAGM